jgi:thiamine pyrophosphokinase
MIKQFNAQLDLTVEYSTILANGEISNSKFIKDLIKKSKILICCDGAIEYLIKHKIKPNVIIGDCDSIKPEVKLELHDKIIFDPNQNNNDLTKAALYAKRKNYDNIIIIGATGYREDHTIANIGLLFTYEKLFQQICIISEYGILSVHNGKTKIKCKIGQQISFFTNNSNTIISCAELKWPLNNISFENWSSGTLNQATSDIMQITSSDVFIVYRSFEIKS